jgi:hypothetical protein
MVELEGAVANKMQSGAESKEWWKLLVDTI